MDFKTFIKEQLQIADVNEEYREKFTDEKGLSLFLAAVTHPSHDAENNYQELEFIGDGIIKGILSQYIPRRFPDLAKGSKKATGEGVLSKTRRFLEQRKTLSDFALQRGFWDHVRADEETKSKLRKETLEDVFEAFVGALVEVIDTKVKRGLGYFYAYNYVQASLDELEIEISSETLDDPITRLNELYKANELQGGKQLLKWNDAAYITSRMVIPVLGYEPKDARIGDVYFPENGKVPLIYTSKGWLHISQVPLMNIQPYPKELPPVEENERPTDRQMIWYAGVYGLPRTLGRGPDPALTGIKPQQIINNPNQYGAEIIGQGLSFKMKEAKKGAALQALRFLNNKGFKK